MSGPSQCLATAHIQCHSSPMFLLSMVTVTLVIGILYLTSMACQEKRPICVLYYTLWLAVKNICLRHVAWIQIAAILPTSCLSFRDFFCLFFSWGHLIHLGCYLKMPWTAQFINNRNSLLKVLENGNSKMKASSALVSGEGLFLIYALSVYPETSEYMSQKKSFLLVIWFILGILSQQLKPTHCPIRALIPFMKKDLSTS